MPSGRLSRQVSRLLDEVERAVEQQEWTKVRSVADTILRLDPSNQDAIAYLAAAGRTNAPPSESPQGAGSDDGAERRWLTVMFCDLVSSTALSEKLDPEDMRDVLRAYQGVCASVVESFDGRIAHYIGDGVLAYFGYPLAHEDDALRAVRAGLGIVQGLATTVAQWTVDEVLTGARVGIHTGLVVVGEMGAGDRVEVADIVGETANLAARVQSEAQAGEVLISDATAALVAGAVQAEDLGERTLRGFSKARRLHRVTGLSTGGWGSATRDFLGPYIGGEDTLATLRDLWADASHGSGRAALVHGEPGIGKSRLIREFAGGLEAGTFTRIAFECSSHSQNSALRPVITHLATTVLGLSPSSPDNVNKFLRGMSEAGVPDADAAFIAYLLGVEAPEMPLPEGLSPEEIRRRTILAILDWFAREARRRPIILIVEDAHWADPSTLELLEDLVSRAPALPVLVLASSRSLAGLRWTRRPYATSIGLQRLPAPRVRELVVHILGGGQDEAVVEQVVARSDGVPLFAEELARAAREMPWSEASPAGGRAIPGTLAESLTARLDRLGPAKQVALAASVVGRQFSTAVLSEVVGKSRDELASPIQVLVEAGIIEPVRGQYAFRHALLRDTAYQSMLRPRRQELHGRIAATLAAAPEPSLEPEIVAFHYSHARQHREALDWWVKAGHAARAHWANLEAIAHYQQALESLEQVSAEDGPDAARELVIRLAIGPSLIAVRGYTSPEVEANYQRADVLCEQIGDPAARVMALNGLKRFYQVRGDLARARQIASEVRDLAASSPAGVLRGLAALNLGEVETLGGRPRIAIPHLQEAIALLDPLVGQGEVEAAEAAIAARCHLALSLWNAGEPDSALESVQAALRLADEHHRPFRKAYALTVAAWVHELRQEPEEAERLGLAGQRLAVELGFPYWENSALLSLGYVSVALGRPEEGVERLTTAAAVGEATGATTAFSRLYGGLAAALAAVGDLSGAMTQIERAIANAQRTGERFCEPDLFRIQAHIHLLRGDTGSARTDFDRALHSANEGGLASYELRIALDRMEALGPEPEHVAAVGGALGRFPGKGQGVDYARARRALAGLAPSTKGDT
ncbi:MAG: adenylate/guanylate cyclase domain-containing protein, partial [Dehalococcoidia bacterium]